MQKTKLKKHSLYMRDWRRKNPNYESALVTLKFNFIRELYGGKCWICGSTDKLEFAHIIPTGLYGMGRGKRNRLKDVINNPECYALLCNYCHHNKFDVLSPELKEEFIKKLFGY